MGYPAVTVYTLPACRSCDRVKDKLTEAGIDFEVYDLLENPEAYTFIKDVLRVNSVPVVASDTHEPIIGYQPDKLAELIDYYTASETGL